MLAVCPAGVEPTGGLPGIEIHETGSSVLFSLPFTSVIKATWSFLSLRVRYVFFFLIARILFDRLLWREYFFLFVIRYQIFFKIGGIFQRIVMFELVLKKKNF